MIFRDPVARGGAVIHNNRKVRGTFMRRLLFVILLLTGSTGLASGADVSIALRGIKQVELVIEDLDQAARSCGVTEDRIHDAFMYPASSARFRVLEKRGTPSDPAFYIAVTTVTSSGVCASSIEVRLYYDLLVTIPSSGSPVWAEGQALESHINLNFWKK